MFWDMLQRVMTQTLLSVHGSPLLKKNPTAVHNGALSFSLICDSDIVAGKFAVCFF